MLKLLLLLTVVAVAVPAASAQPFARTAGCSPPSSASAWNGDTRAPQVFGPRRVALRSLFFLPEQASWSGGGQAVFAGLTGQEVKIAWGMIGSGRFGVVAHGPAGEQLKPVWGPDRHSGGNWVHPGGEWGTGFVFPEPGCWRIHAVDGRRTGDVWLLLQ